MPLNGGGGSGGPTCTAVRPGATTSTPTASGSGASETDSPTWTTGVAVLLRRHQPVEQVLHQHREAGLQRQVGLVDVEAENADSPTGLFAHQQQRRLGRGQHDVGPAGRVESAGAADVHAGQRDVGQQRVVLAHGADGRDRHVGPTRRRDRC